MHVFLVAHSILLPDSHTSHAPPPQSLDQALYITGNCKALGDWAVDDVKGPMVLDPNYESPTYRLSVDLPADISIQYKYCIKRNTILSSWEVRFWGRRWGDKARVLDGVQTGEFK